LFSSSIFVLKKKKRKEKLAEPHDFFITGQY